MATRRRNVTDGGALTTDGTNIYAFQGKTTAFWRYNVATNTWTTLAPSRAATDQGGALVFAPGVNPQGRFTALTASRSLVVTGDTVKVTFSLTSSTAINNVTAGRPDDADERRVVQHPDRPDADQRRQRHLRHRRPGRLRVDMHGRRGRQLPAA